MTRPADFPQDPKILWDIFYQFTRHPRPSGHEKKVLIYIKALATKHGSKWKEDERGNLVVYVPPTEDMKDSAPLLVQNHVDMVCDNTPDRIIDFENDPIDIKIENGWLLADRTTLGGDNGMGCAAALALMVDQSVSHPPMELLFTVEEETGLHGACALDASLITAKRMLNLDTEDWGMVFVGCAGGFHVIMNGELETEPVDSSEQVFKIEIKGLRGGHSGIDIHLQQGNAIILLSSFIAENNLRVCSFEGGRSHNIIPRDARAWIISDTFTESEIRAKLDAYVQETAGALHVEDQKISYTLEDSAKKIKLNKESNSKFLSLILSLPHGAHKFERESKDVLVSQSSNLAQVKLEEMQLEILSSVRYFDPLDTKKIKAAYKMMALHYELSLDMGGGYPSWKPVYNGEMLDLVKKTYKRIFDLEPEVTAIHAGLECGVIKDKLPHLDIVSIGPNIRSAHTPRERIEIKTVKDFWKLLVEVVKAL